jgi:hypothetical protein
MTQKASGFCVYRKSEVGSEFRGDGGWRCFALVCFGLPCFALVLVGLLWFGFPLAFVLLLAGLSG